MITVYSKPACPQCDQTKKWLDREGVPFTARDVTVDPAARDEVVALGYAALPVVVTAGGDHWSGFRLERLKALVTAAA